MQFVKVKVDDLVFDAQSKTQGKVKYINNKTNVVKIEVILNEEVINGESVRTTTLKPANLFDLTVIKSAYKKQQSIDPNQMFEWVKIFHKTFGHPVADKPQSLPLRRGINRTAWTAEEAIAEFLRVSSNNKEEYLVAKVQFLTKLEEAFNEQLTKPFPTNEVDRIVDQSDALGDALYLIFGSFVEMGVKPYKVFEAIQTANMSKLDADGNVVLKKDGKIGKSDLFTPPEADIKKETERQILAASNNFESYNVAQ